MSVPRSCAPPASATASVVSGSRSTAFSSTLRRGCGTVRDGSLPAMHPRLTVVDHPLASRHLAALRDCRTPSQTFRAVLSDVSMLLLYEALRDLRVDETTVETPLGMAP